MKICSLYGAGFYYIPGTDMCLKIGGWTRVYEGYGVNGNVTNGALATGDNNTRSTANVAARVRGYITADARNQTEYGTVRSYIAVGYSAGGASSGVSSGNINPPGTNASLSNFDTGSGGFNANRAFIQFAGFTFGLTPSFYDFYSQSATSFWGGMINPASDTSDGGTFVFGGYTAQFGNGFSATLAAENPRTTAVLNGGSTTMFVVTTGSASTGNLGLPPASSAEGTQWPDVVANLRVDQAWGSAQVMGAIHNASATYYTSSDASGHPSDAVGWAVGAGVKINFPSIGPGDYLQAQVNYTEGARKYVDASYTNMYSMFNGGAYGIGIGSDGVFCGNATNTAACGSNSSIELTTAWGVNAAYEHFWTKKWQTSVYGAYTATSYDSTANGYLCTAEVASGAFSLAGATCDNNFQVWTIGTRTQFNLDSNTYIGVDVVYEQLNTGLAGMQANFGNGAEAASPRTVSDQSAWMAEFRVHRNFYP